MNDLSKKRRFQLALAVLVTAGVCADFSGGAGAAGKISKVLAKKLGDGAQENSCRAEITKAVYGAARLVGIRREFGFELNPTGVVLKTDMGEQLVEYATSVFILHDGYITGSGAIIAVQPTATSCEVIRLNITAR